MATIFLSLKVEMSDTFYPHTDMKNTKQKKTYE